MHKIDFSKKKGVAEEMALVIGALLIVIIMLVLMFTFVEKQRSEELTSEVIALRVYSGINSLSLSENKSQIELKLPDKCDFIEINPNYIITGYKNKFFLLKGKFSSHSIVENTKTLCIIKSENEGIKLTKGECN